MNNFNREKRNEDSKEILYDVKKASNERKKENIFIGKILIIKIDDSSRRV